MFKPDEIEGFSMALDSQMTKLEERIMSDIVRRIRINGEITRSADWQLSRLRQLGMSRQEIADALKDSLGYTDEQMRQLYSAAIESGYARDEELYIATGKEFVPFEENAELQQLISAVAVQTNEELQNITQSLGFAQRGLDGKLHFTGLADYYQQTLDTAMFDISSGAFDYNTVLKRVIKEMTHSGLRTVDYATGHSNRVTVAARRALMTGMAQLTAKVNEDNAAALETDTYEISWHTGARPSHWWGGRWYKKDELVSICGLGDVTGLCGANCYHDYYPVVPGVSEPTYSKDELDELNRKEQEKVSFGGKEYNKYEATQRQRQLETTMRAQREQIKLLKEGGADEDDIIAARARYRATSAEYSRFSAAMDLPQQRERVTMDGLGNIGQGKYKVQTLQQSPSDFQSKPGRDDKAVADMEYIKSQAYADKFKGKYASEHVENAVVSACRQVIKNRDGTFYEEAYFIDARTGRTISYIKGKQKNGIKMSEKLKKDLTSAPEKSIIMIHNHPNSTPPSTEDFITAAKLKSCFEAVSCGHNGDVYAFRNVYNAQGAKLGTIFKNGKKTPYYEGTRDFYIAQAKYLRNRHTELDAWDLAWQDTSKTRGFSYEKR